jgi:hypothetical protein
MTEICTRPPPGWYCTRGPNHDGPCAAVPESAGGAIARQLREMGRNWALCQQWRLLKLAEQLDYALVDALTTGHGQGQEHAIADVNAGFVDDMIQQRLDRATQCDCGAKMTQCSNCAVSEYQGDHTDCKTCCPGKSIP